MGATSVVMSAVSTSATVSIMHSTQHHGRLITAVRAAVHSSASTTLLASTSSTSVLLVLVFLVLFRARVLLVVAGLVLALLVTKKH